MKYLLFFLISALAFLVAACTDSSRTVQDTDIPAQDSDEVSDSDTSFLPDEDPASEELAKALMYSMQEYIIFSGEPAVQFGLRIPGQSVWNGASGVTDTQTLVPATADTIFGTGSNSKPFIAVIIMQLRNEGKLSLDEPFSTYVPGYPEWNGITIRNLLHMQSGIPDYLHTRALQWDAISDPGRKWTPEQLLAYVYGTPLEFTPGSSCKYSNTNTIILGLVIEAVTGRKVSEVLRSNIFAPLNLTCTFFDGEESITGIMATGYGEFMGNFYIFTDVIDPSMAWTAGSVVSCTRDLTSFFEVLFRTEALLPRTTLEEMMDFTECELSGRTMYYGLGLMESSSIYGKAYGHGGTSYGFSSMLYYIIDKNLIVGGLNNYVPEQLYYFSSDALNRIINKVYTTWPVCEKPENFDSNTSPDFLSFDFKGPINEKNTQGAAPGIGRTYVTIGETSYQIFQSYVDAEAAGDTANPTINITMLGEMLDETSTLSSIIISRQFLLEAKSQGIEDIIPQNNNDVLAMEGTGFFNAQGTAEKICYSAISDYSTGSAFIRSCSESNSSFSPGEVLRVHGNLPLTTDKKIITDTLGMIYGAPFTTPCICPVVPSGWGPCP